MISCTWQRLCRPADSGLTVFQSGRQTELSTLWDQWTFGNSARPEHAAVAEQGRCVHVTLPPHPPTPPWPALAHGVLASHSARLDTRVAAQRRQQRGVLEPGFCPEHPWPPLTSLYLEALQSQRPQGEIWVRNLASGKSIWSPFVPQKRSRRKLPPVMGTSQFLLVHPSPQRGMEVKAEAIFPFPHIYSGGEDSLDNMEKYPHCKDPK
ncbi:uncharacterized protein LOC119514727 [Choloepus didactylus]|uniref:uncharacterized protein LOC119514727 n=1 Tax=Choloepus didactylus TaxID=27675 RepID=UPI0018A088B4|nr:uncharacterized protein LOC119514727 [Choloepus didactylus]